MIRKRRKKIAVTAMAAITAAASIAPVAASADTTKKFSDVNDRTVSPKSTQDAIYRLVDMYAIDGFPDGTFKPNKEVSRAQASKILTGAFGLSLPENLEWALRDYKDVGPNHEYAVFIAATTVTEVFKGNQKGKFDPWSSMTRAQMAIVLGRVLEKYDTDEDVNVNLDNVPEEAKEGVQIIANLGVTTELEDFRPNQHVTRAQMAAFSIRAADVIDANSGIE